MSRLSRKTPSATHWLGSGSFDANKLALLVLVDCLGQWRLFFHCRPRGGNPPPSASWEAPVWPRVCWWTIEMQRCFQANQRTPLVFILVGNWGFVLLETNLKTWRLMSTLRGSIANGCSQCVWMLLTEETNHSWQLAWENYDLRVACGPLIFPIWPAELQEIKLLVSPAFFSQRFSSHFDKERNTNGLQRHWFLLYLLHF